MCPDGTVGETGTPLSVDKTNTVYLGVITDDRMRLWFEWDGETHEYMMPFIQARRLADSILSMIRIAQPTKR